MVRTTRNGGLSTIRKLPARILYREAYVVAAERHRSTAGGALKGARKRAVGLHFKEANCDEYLGHRACQLQRLVLRHGAGTSATR